MPPTITPITPSDHPRLVEVWEASVRATHHFLMDADIAYFKGYVQQDDFFVGVDLAGVRGAEGQIDGFVGVQGDKLEMLFVHPDRFRQGIGRALLQYAVEVMGANTVDVNEQNEGAVAFYLERGFAVVGRSPVDGQGKPFPLLHLRRIGADDQ